MKKRVGFTLIELIIVVIVVGILASIGIARYSQVIERARSAEAYAVLADVASAESAYYVENNAYTSDFTQLDRYSAAPTSENFTFSLTGSYSQATSTKGGPCYRMNFSGAKVACQ